MEQLFDKYKNIQLFATSPKYRNYKLLDDKFDDFETFKNKIQLFGYIMHSFRDKNSNPIDLYLFEHESQYIKDTNYFKKILDKYTGQQTIILITKEELNVYRKKSIELYPHINCKNYLHKHFIMEMNKGPLCSKHTILSHEEVRSLCYNTMTHGHRFPSILESDPQNIWIGGQVNDIIMIEPYSEITGQSVHYRIVTPVSGKSSQNKARAEPQWASQKNDITLLEGESQDKIQDNYVNEKEVNDRDVNIHDDEVDDNDEVNDQDDQQHDIQSAENDQEEYEEEYEESDYEEL